MMSAIRMRARARRSRGRRSASVRRSDSHERNRERLGRVEVPDVAADAEVRGEQHGQTPPPTSTPGSLLVADSTSDLVNSTCVFISPEVQPADRGAPGRSPARS